MSYVTNESPTPETGLDRGLSPQVTESDRHGGKQPAKEHAEREHEETSKEDGE